LPEFGSLKEINNAENPLTKELLPPKDHLGETVDTNIISFKQLLTHSSGLPAWRSIYKECGPVPPVVCAQEDILERQRKTLELVKNYDMYYIPDQDYIYRFEAYQQLHNLRSDIGLIWLGFALSKCANEALISDVIQKFVLDPLDIHARYVPLIGGKIAKEKIAPTEFDAWRNRRVWGEVHDENTAGMGGISAHAGLFGTAEDLCKLGK
jgi:CubicO group peptidase (beta-lactamase class C family)